MKGSPVFGSRRRKIFRDIWSRKGRTVLVSMAVFIGVLGVVTLVSVGDLVTRQLREDLKQDELAMVRAFVNVSGGAELDNVAYLKMLRELPDVTDVQGNASYPILWKASAGNEFVKGHVRACSEPFGEIPLEPMRLIRGRYPVIGSKQVAIERRMADKYGLRVNDELTLQIWGDTAGAEPNEENWTIVGVVFHPYTSFDELGSFGFIPNETSVYAAYEDARYIAGFTGFRSIYARYTDYPTAERQADSFSAAIRENTPFVVTFNYVEDPAENLFIVQGKQYTDVMAMLAMLAMVVAGFLVTNVISTIVLEQKRQIGVMKSLGATRWDNFVMYAGLAFAYGLIGLTPAVLLGIPLGNLLARAFAEFLNVLIEGDAVSLLGVGLGIGMGLVVPVLASVIPVYNGTKVTILEAMTDLGISTGYGGGRAAKLIGALRLPVNVRQALSELVQKRGRLALTVVTLTFAVAAFMGVYAVFFNLNRVLGNVFDTYGYEIQVTPTDIQNTDEVQRLILDNVEGVGAVYPGVSLALQAEGYVQPMLGTNTLMTIGFDPSSDAFKLNLKEGTAWQGDPAREGIVLPVSIAQQLGKKAGDTLTISSAGESDEIEIIGIDRLPFDFAFMEWRALARLSGLALDAPTPNQYLTPVQVKGYAGPMPGGQVVAVGIDEQVGGFLTFEAGANLTTGQPGVIVSADMAANGGYQVGDQLELNGGGDAKTYPIVGIFNLPPQMVSLQASAAEGELTDVIGIFWKELAALEGRELGGEPAPNTLRVQLKDTEATSDQVDEVIQAISKEMLGRGITANYINQVKVAEENAQMIMSMGMIFNTTAVVMAAVGAIGLLTTLSMSVFERQKEIGVMRSIGAGSATVAAQFLVEGVLVGLIAWIIGVPLSYLLSLALMAALPLGFIEFSFPLVSLVIGLVGMVVIAIVASLWPSISAARKTVSEIIRYQ